MNCIAGGQKKQKLCKSLTCMGREVRSSKDQEGVAWCCRKGRMVAMASEAHKVKPKVSWRQTSPVRKILKPPEAFSPATIEEEVSQWSDWAFTFKNFLAFMGQAFLTDLKSAEDQKDEISNDISNAFFGDDRERMNRGMKLYSVLSSYLRNRPLKVAEDRKEKEEVSEEVLEKEKERKVERVCGRLKEKATKVEKEKADKELFATIAVRPATLLLSAGRHQVEKEKEKAEKEKCGMFRKLEH
eukprot:s2311_g9.t1